MTIPRSRIPEVRFPAIVEPAAATLMALMLQLEESQWWSPEKLRRIQLEQLTEVVRHARDTTKLYRPRLAMFDLDEVLTEERVRELPTLSRRDLQTAGNAIFSEAYPKTHGPASSVMTSGSTGQPVTVLQSEVVKLFWSAFTLRDHRWHKRDLSGHLGVIKYVAGNDEGQMPDGTRAQAWGMATDIIYPPAPATLLSVGLPVADQADWLQRTNPDYLISHPSNLHALAEHFRDEELTPPGRLAQIRTLAESLKDETRALCRKVFGVGIADMYSTQEVGYIALQCPEHERYHVQSESLYVEVLDEDGQPCGPGQVGRVVVSSLHNFASPLVRYAIGDYAEVGEPCPCGRGLPTLNRIVGRERGMWVRPDGQRAWPLISSKVCRKAAPYVQMRLEQLERDLIRVLIVPEGSFEPEHQRALTAALHACLEFEVPLEFEIVDSIPRGAGGKFEEFVCRIEA